MMMLMGVRVGLGILMGLRMDMLWRVAFWRFLRLLVVVALRSGCFLSVSAVLGYILHFSGPLCYISAVRTVWPSTVVVRAFNQETIVCVFTNSRIIIWRRCCIDVICIHTCQKRLIRSAIWLHEVLPLPLTAIVPAVANKTSKFTDSYLVKFHIAVFLVVFLDISERVVIICNYWQKIKIDALCKAGQRFFSLNWDRVSASAFRVFVSLDISTRDLLASILRLFVVRVLVISQVLSVFNLIFIFFLNQVLNLELKQIALQVLGSLNCFVWNLELIRSCLSCDNTKHQGRSKW